MMKMEQYFPTKRSVLLHLLLPCFLLNPCTADIFLFRCSSTKFAANTPYQSNLLTLLSSLSSNATGSTEFYNATVGITNEPNTVYGLFMCRGDVSHQLCQECVSSATQKIASYCWLAKQAIIWHQFCFVRYSNRYFFSHVDEQPQIYAFDLNNVSDGTSSAWTLSNTLNQVAGDAASCGPAGTKKFATKEARVSEGRTLYTLAQCTPDLSMEDCRRCLLDAIENIVKCCLGRTGGRVAYPSCKIRFEVYQFYWNVAMLPSTTAGGPRLKGEDGNRKIGSQMMVVIVVAAVVSVMLLGLGADFLRKRARKSIQAVLRENLLGDETTTLGSLQFNLATIEAATNKFSPENKIGKGGFGEVYKEKGIPLTNYNGRMAS